MGLVSHGLYVISDNFFNDYVGLGDFKYNKNNSRPHYFAFKDKDGVFWMVPMSSQVGHYRRKIEKIKKQKKECIYYEIGVIANKEVIFLISKFFPIIPRYIHHAYTIDHVHYIVKDKNLVKSLTNKIKRYILLIEQGKIKSDIDVLKLKKVLAEKDL